MEQQTEQQVEQQSEVQKPRKSATNIEQNLITILQRRGILSPDKADEVAETFGEAEESLEKHLEKQYGVEAHEVCLALAEHAGVPVLKLSVVGDVSQLIADFPAALMREHKAVPVARTTSCLTLALADPLDVVAVEEFANNSKLHVIPVAAPESEIDAVLEELLESVQQGDELGEALEAMGDVDVEMAESGDGEIDIAAVSEQAEEATVVKIVNMIILEAMNRGASDIHVEAFERKVRLRYRVDGALEEGPAPPKGLQNAIVSRVKVMADLNIAERRIPQDGKFRLKAKGKDIDFRVSTLPMVFGEKLCLRILDKGNLKSSLDELKLDPKSLRQLRYAIKQPHGLILVTGPTGSGKTTTLYSALQEINTVDLNITTTENPVEYNLEGINQVQIIPEQGLTFAAALRSILRQDPDVVLVGETRDGETANIAVEAALTGHLVFTTLHTNDAPGAVTRLGQMGIEPFMLASSLLLAQAQRLCKTICPNCKDEVNIADELTPEYLEDNHIPMELFEDGKMPVGRGCSRCEGKGMKGRTGVMEILLLDQDIREQILKGANADEIRDFAVEHKEFRELRTAGFYRVREGVTTIMEVLRVTSQD